MSIDIAIDHLNNLSAEEAQKRARVQRLPLRELLKNPPTYEYSLALEEARTAVVQMFEAADENTRRGILTSLTKQTRNGFLGYAADMAVLAIRRDSPKLIEHGLIALVMEGAAQDFRDSIVVMAKLHHSALKLKLDSQKAFEKAADLADPGVIKQELKAFCQRSPRDRDLKTYYWMEENGADGFRYKQVLPWLSANGAEAAKPRPVETPQQISARLTPGQQNAMIQMAGTLAMMAVRTRSPKLVEDGLQGLALGGGALASARSLATLAKLHHSALKLGMNSEEAFAKAAEFAPPGDLKSEMIKFPFREPKERDLSAFGLQETITEKGFDYEQTGPGQGQT